MSFKSPFPGLYIDLVTPVELNRDIVLINRNPEPNECFVLVNQQLSFDIVSVGPNAIDDSSITLYINGEDVSLNTTIVTNIVCDSFGNVVCDSLGNTVVVSEPLFAFECVAITGGYRCTLIDNTGWEPNTTVEVRVTATDGNEALDETYLFKVEDKIQPEILKVIPASKQILRVRFNEQVLQESSTGINDALNPNNYVIDTNGDGITAVCSVNVVSVASFSATEIDVTLDVPMTNGGLYRIIPGPIADLNNNLMDVVAQNKPFVGFVYPFAPEREFSIVEMWPDAAFGLDCGINDLKRVAGTLQDITDLMLCKIDEWGQIIDPDLAPEKFLDAMLCDLGNPFAFDFTVTQKRLLVQNLVALYKLKGTKEAIVLAGQFFFSPVVTVTDVLSPLSSGLNLGTSVLGFDFEINASNELLTYSFSVQVDRDLTTDETEKFIEIIKYLKPAHTHLLSIVSPSEETVVNHWELGRSDLGENTILHEG